MNQSSICLKFKLIARCFRYFFAKPLRKENGCFILIDNSDPVDKDLTGENAMLFAKKLKKSKEIYYANSKLIVLTVFLM